MFFIWSINYLSDKGVVFPLLPTCLFMTLVQISKKVLRFQITLFRLVVFHFYYVLDYIVLPARRVLPTVADQPAPLLGSSAVPVSYKTTKQWVYWIVKSKVRCFLFIFFWACHDCFCSEKEASLIPLTPFCKYVTKFCWFLLCNF